MLRELVEQRLRFLRERRDGFLVPDRIIAASPARIDGIARGAFARGRHWLPATICGDQDLTTRPTDDGLHDDLRDFRADDLAAPRLFDVALALDWARADDDAAASAERLLELMGSVEARELVIEVPAAPSAPLDETRVDHRVGLLDVLAEKGGFSTRSYVVSPDPRSHVYHLVRG